MFLLEQKPCEKYILKSFGVYDSIQLVLKLALAIPGVQKTLLANLQPLLGSSSSFNTFSRWHAAQKIESRRDSKESKFVDLSLAK